MSCLLQTIWHTMIHWLNGGTAIVEGHTLQDQGKIDAWVVISKCVDCGHETWHWMRKDNPMSAQLQDLPESKEDI